MHADQDPKPDPPERKVPIGSLPETTSCPVAATMALGALWLPLVAEQAPGIVIFLEGDSAQEHRLRGVAHWVIPAR